MATLTGYLDPLGHPHFKFDVYGLTPSWKQTIDAMFDSGFSGFLNLPLSICLSTGLILHSTSTYTLADGSKSTTLLCLGTILLGSPTFKVIGAISIDFSTSDCLLGMEFLKNLNGKLTLDYQNKTVKIEYSPTTPPISTVKVGTSLSPSASESSSVSPSQSPSPSLPDKTS